ncbi:MAG: aspartyl protease family protein [Nitrososphaerales archaeon]
MRAQNQPVPAPSNCPALVDTGASGLALDSTVVQALQLRRQGVVTNDTAGGRRIANQHFVSLDVLRN